VSIISVGTSISYIFSAAYFARIFLLRVVTGGGSQEALYSMEFVNLELSLNSHVSNFVKIQYK
jgi:hypothetical protein